MFKHAETWMHSFAHGNAGSRPSAFSLAYIALLSGLRRIATAIVNRKEGVRNFAQTRLGLGLRHALFELDGKTIERGLRPWSKFNAHGQSLLNARR